MINKSIVLNNGLQIPSLGFGTYKAADDRSTEVIRMAIEAGYRYFDTASFYETEGYLADAIKECGVPREKLTIASKVWRSEMGYENTKKAFSQTLERLQTDYLDLYLIHWPRPLENENNWKMADCETWHAMEELYREGKVRAIGLSNFLPHHIENIMTVATVFPAVNQIEFHPGYTQSETVKYCQERKIAVQAWSPMGRGRVLQDALILELSEKYNVTPAQICMRYCLQHNVMPLPKASSQARMNENKDVWEFTISDDDMNKIDAMPETGWSGEHPDRDRVPQ